MIDVKHILTDNILPFWMGRMVDGGRGGFYGRIDGKGLLHPDAGKGGILCGRILWSFSAAFRVMGDPKYLECATRAKEYLEKYFYDPDYGGIYWMLDCDGRPLDTKKQFYAIGFAIYGLSEYVRATGDNGALDLAVRLFHSIDGHSRDGVLGGCIEACTRDWRPLTDMRLSEKDANEAKTMNTHLHILEPYANLLRVWDNPLLRSRLRELIEIFLYRIEDPETHHLGLFFDEKWHRKDHMVSYGHDIEASWLLVEAAEVLGDRALLAEVKKHSAMIYRASLEGIQPDGSMIYEIREDGSVRRDRDWWPQAETAVGAHWAGDFETRDRVLQYIDSHLIDWEGGEWFGSVREDGSVNTDEDKAGFWKCPYHNSRMCIELLTR